MRTCSNAPSIFSSAGCASASATTREPLYIKTVRSEGYVFSVPIEIVEQR